MGQSHRGRSACAAGAAADARAGRRARHRPHDRAPSDATGTDATTCSIDFAVAPHAAETRAGARGAGRITSAVPVA